MKNFLSILMMLLVAVSDRANGDDNKLPVPSKEKIAKFLMTYQKTPFADRGKYVTDPKEFEKAQEKYYEGSQILEDMEVTVISVKSLANADYMNVTVRHNATLNGKKINNVLDYFVKNTKHGLELDWSASVGYNPVGFNTWLAGTDNTLTLRVEAELDSYFNYHYRDAKDTHYSISFLDNYRKQYTSFNGYVAKESALGKKLFDILKDGHKYNMMVTVEQTGRETKLVGIRGLVSETWVK